MDIRCGAIPIEIATEFAWNIIHSMARSKGGYSDLKGIVREFFNAARENIDLIK